MRISGSTPALPPVASQARSTRRPEADAPAQAPTTPAPVPTAETPETEAPAKSGKANGLVRASEHSHRSDVAALRQWFNHPDLRNDLPLPDLSIEHKGNGFRNAVAAYEAAIATENRPPATEPTPVTTGPEPVVTDPEPVVSEPAPIVPDPTPVVSDPDPLLDVLLPQEPTPGEEASPA